MCIQFKKLESFTPIQFLQRHKSNNIRIYIKLYIANTVTRQLCCKNIHKHQIYIPVCFVGLGPILLCMTEIPS